jgi:hypothetical protein
MTGQFETEDIGKDDEGNGYGHEAVKHKEMLGQDNPSMS